MAPRQLSSQSSMDELSAGSSSSSMVGDDGGTRPLIFHDHGGPTESSLLKGAPAAQLSSISNTTTTSTVSSEASEGPTPAQIEVARFHHDCFNLVALLVVIASAVIDWDFPLLFQGVGSLAYKDKYFWVTWTTILGYFLIDLLWVTRIPHCVKSPKTIVQHHFVVLFYLLGPVLWPTYRWFVGPVLSVEINTWFLILRRVVYKKNIVMLSDAVSFSFYLSWIIIRCGVHPLILFEYLCLAKEKIQETGQLWHWPMIMIFLQFVLCCLNLKWSYDLFCPIVKSWFVREEGARRRTPSVVSNGL